MVYSHILADWDRAFMGSVTHLSRAQDPVEMARIVGSVPRRWNARTADQRPGQRELADVVDFQHAWLGQGLRREQPDQR